MFIFYGFIKCWYRNSNSRKGFGLKHLFTNENQKTLNFMSQKNIHVYKRMYVSVWCYLFHMYKLYIRLYIVCVYMYHMILNTFIFSLKCNVFHINFISSCLTVSLYQIFMVNNSNRALKLIQEIFTEHLIWI